MKASEKRTWAELIAIYALLLALGALCAWLDGTRSSAEHRRSHGATQSSLLASGPTMPPGPWDEKPARR